MIGGQRLGPRPAPARTRPPPPLPSSAAPAASTPGHASRRVFMSVQSARRRRAKMADPSQGLPDLFRLHPELPPGRPDRRSGTTTWPRATRPTLPRRPLDPEQAAEGRPRERARLGGSSQAQATTAFGWISRRSSGPPGRDPWPRAHLDDGFAPARGNGPLRHAIRPPGILKSLIPIDRRIRSHHLGPPPSRSPPVRWRPGLIGEQAEYPLHRPAMKPALYRTLHHLIVRLKPSRSKASGASWSGRR